MDQSPWKCQPGDQLLSGNIPQQCACVASLAFEEAGGSADRFDSSSDQMQNQTGEV